MKGKIKYAALIAIIVVVLSQKFLLRIDDQANQDFLEKATALNLKGRNKKFVQSQFGPFDYTNRSDKDEVWVYTPGPVWAIWNSECKIAFDEKGVVKSWMVRSD